MADTEPRVIRVLLLGSQPIILAGLRLLLDAAPDINVVGDSTSLTAQEMAVPADVLVLDLDGGGDLLSVVAPSIPQGVRLLIVGNTIDHETLASAFRQGATGAVRKQQGADMLAKAVRTVHKGDISLERSDMERLVTELSATTPNTASPEARRTASLTPRERQVVALIGEGLRNQQIATRLHISEVTVRNHLTSIFHKLKLSGRLPLALYAFKHGLSTLPLTIHAHLPAKSGRKRPRGKRIS